MVNQYQNNLSQSLTKTAKLPKVTLSLSFKIDLILSSMHFHGLFKIFRTSLLDLSIPIAASVYFFYAPQQLSN